MGIFDEPPAGHRDRFHQKFDQVRAEPNQGQRTGGGGGGSKGGGCIVVILAWASAATALTARAKGLI